MKRINIVCGHYGSGKTEFSINFALYLHNEYGIKVSIADYDVINPYFRSRERADFLKAYNIDILGNSTDNATGTDLPAFSSNIYGPLTNNEFLVIDLAGSQNGLKPLALIRDALKDNYEFLCVLNAFRADTDTAVKMTDTVRKMETFSGLEITGLVHNSHLIHETTSDDVLYGQQMVLEASKRLNKPLLYTQIRQDIYEQIRDRLVGKTIVFKELAMRDEWI